jgi:ferritin-like metal-binding protein YciE
MALKSLEAAFVDELKDLLSAEKQLTKAQPRMAKNATNSELQTALEEHLKETENHVTRIEGAFAALGRKASSKTCKAMQGLVEEGSELLKEDAEAAVKDALIIAAAQKVEHYEIASYGTVCAWADSLGKTEASELLKQNLSEEKQADQKLTRIARKVVNPKAQK